MEQKLYFTDKTELLRFLDTEQYDKERHELTDFSLVYRLNAEFTLRTSDKSYHLHLLGTNHAREENSGQAAESEKESVDMFLGRIGKGSTILIEQGFGLNSYTQDNIIDMYIKPAVHDPDLKDSINIKRLQLTRIGEEIRYSADQAYGRGIRLKNMDIRYNPKALPYLEKRFGLENNVKELKGWIEQFVVNDFWLNSFTKKILSDSGIQIEESMLASISPFESSAELAYDRDAFMAETVFNELEDESYVIAHTCHIKDILRVICKRGDTAHFSARADYTPETEWDLRKVKKILASLDTIKRSLGN